MWQGNEACAEAALAAGMRFFAGYPITPASEISEVLARRLPEEGGVFIQMEDEIGSIAAVVGASMAGVKAMTATSGPGFSLMQENIGFAAAAEIPVVIVDVQRIGPSSGVATHPSQGDVMQARWGTHGDHTVIALAPWSVREMYELTVQAFNLAEQYRTPVILLSDAALGHMSEDMVVPRPDELPLVERRRPTVGPDEYRPYEAGEDGVPAMACFGDGYVWRTSGMVHDETGFAVPNSPEIIGRELTRLENKIRRHEDRIVRWDARWLPAGGASTAGDQAEEPAEVAVVAYGVVARAAGRAVRMLRERGIRAGLFRPVTLWPFPAEALKRAAGGLRAIVVAELNFGQIAGEVKKAVDGLAPVHHLGRVDTHLITPAEIVAAVEEAIRV